MEGKMRSVWQQQQLTSYCLYGSKRNMMLNIFNNSNSPFYRFGQVIFMQKIAKEHWIPLSYHLLRRPASEFQNLLPVGFAMWWSVIPGICSSCAILFGALRFLR